MVVNANGVEYVSIPEDGKLIYDQMSLTLYRASMFHGQPYNNWHISLTKEEFNTLESDVRVSQTLTTIELMNRTFKGIPVKILGEDLS